MRLRAEALHFGRGAMNMASSRSCPYKDTRYDYSLKDKSIPKLMT